MDRSRVFNSHLDRPGTPGRLADPCWHVRAMPDCAGLLLEGGDVVFTGDGGTDTLSASDDPPNPSPRRVDLFRPECWAKEPENKNGVPRDAIRSWSDDPEASAAVRALGKPVLAQLVRAFDGYDRVERR